MREIKFRAWVKKAEWGDEEADRGMFYGVERAYDTLGSMGDGKGGERDYHWQSFESILRQEKDGELILMQFTGLKDKNGKEIYDGDIIGKYVEKENFNLQVIEWVKWDEENGTWRVWDSLVDDLDSWEEDWSENYGFWLGDGAKEKEVIGNIYENADWLVKKKKKNV